MGRKQARRQQLQHTVDVLQKRWGPRAIRRMDAKEAAASHPALPTGFPSVDRLLGIGGLPKGRFTELLGSGTAGQATLAAKALRQAQKARQQAVYVDVNHAVDLDFLHRCGVRFNALTILRPWSFGHALEMTGDLLREGAAGAVVFDRIIGRPHRA